MSEVTNENGVNYTGNEGTVQDGIENAFSDLISEYFEDGNTTENAGKIQSGKVLDWDSVSNGQLYTNLAGTETGYGDDSSYWDAPIYNTVTGETTGAVGETTVTGTVEDYGTAYNGTETNIANGITNETIAKNAYGVITVNGDLLKGVNSEGVIENTVNTVTTAETTGTVGTVADTTVTTGTVGTEFKLTQANLPAKIGFWTKVRNFFMSDSKISYSVEQAGTPNTGLWNKVQNFFSFGKNK